LGHVRWFSSNGGNSCGFFGICHGLLVADVIWGKVKLRCRWKGGKQVFKFCLFGDGVGVHGFYEALVQFLRVDIKNINF
jgi:hypothetical protein